MKKSLILPVILLGILLGFSADSTMAQRKVCLVHGKAYDFLMPHQSCRPIPHTPSGKIITNPEQSQELDVDSPSCYSSYIENLFD